MSTVITTYSSKSGYQEIAIRFSKRSFGGWNIVRADNGRVLGWTVWNDIDKDWIGYLSASAFRGTGTDDLGDVLDHVPNHLFNGLDSLRSLISAVGVTRVDVAEELVYRLVREQAPAVGFGAHFDVHPHHHHNNH